MWALIKRDLVRMIRNPVRTALLFAFPLMLAGIFTLVFGGEPGESISITMLVYDEDQGLVGRFLGGAATSEEMDERLNLIPVGPEGFEMMEQGRASALVHIPEGFSKSLLKGDPTTIRVVKNPSERFLPQLVEEGTRIGASVLSVGSRVFRQELDTISTLSDREGFPSDAAVGMVAEGFNGKLKSLDRWLFPPLIELETTTVTESMDSAKSLSILAYFLPGLSVMAVLFLAQNSTRDILLERESGLLRHLLTGPVSAADYILGKCLSVILIGSIGFLILIVVGLVSGVDWGSFSTTIALVLAAALVAAGSMLLISSIVETDRQSDALSTIVIMLWCMLGGAFVPVSQFPGFLEPVARLTPVYWVVDGFTQAMTVGAGLPDLTTHLVVLAASGFAMLLVGATLLHRRMQRGLL